MTRAPPTEALIAGDIPERLAADIQALLRWSRRTTLEPAAAREADVAHLRELGWDDRAILDATLTVAYFSFVNRIVLLLGVDIEEDYERYCAPE